MERAFGASSLRLPAPCMVPGGAQAGQVFCPLVRASGHQGEACAQTGAHSVSGTGAVGQLCPEGCVHACVCSGVLVCVCACTYVLVHTHVCSCVHMCACVCSCVHVGECFFFLPQGASHQCRVFLLPPPHLPAPFSPPLIFASSWQSFHPPLPALICGRESMWPSSLEAVSLGFKSTRPQLPSQAGSGRQDLCP